MADTDESDDPILDAIYNKFVDAADWPNDQKVEFYTKISQLITQLADGSLARGKRDGSVKARSKSSSKVSIRATSDVPAPEVPRSDTKAET